MSRHRAREHRHHGEIAAWLGAGALTLGVGAALATPAVASADTTHHGGSVPTKGSGDSSGPKAGTTTNSGAKGLAGTTPPHSNRTFHPLAAIPAVGTPSHGASSATQPTGASEKRAASAVSVAIAQPVPATSPPPQLHTSVLSAAATTKSPLGAVNNVNTTSTVSTPPVSPWQPIANLIANALVTFTGMNPHTPTPAPGNLVQLAAYSAARWLEDTVNPAGIPHAGTPTVGTPDPVTGAVTGHVVFTDAAGAPLTYRISTDPTQGTVTINSDGVYTYNPNDASRLEAINGSLIAQFNVIAYNGVQTSNIIVHVPVVSPSLGSVAIPVGSGPLDLALSPNGHQLVVSNSASNTVSVIDTATDTVTATIAVGTSP
ncbi:MAG: Ig-like domain-containing protein, partial [Mycobacterium sp.]